MTIPSAVAEQAKKIEDFYKNQEEPETVDDLMTGGDLKETPDEPKEYRSEQSDSDEATYEKRFKNYKASTDVKLHELRKETERLKQAEAENQKLKQYLSQLEQQKSTEAPKFSKEALNSFSEEELTIFNNLLEDKLEKRTDQLVRKVSYLESKLSEQEQKEALVNKQREHLTLKQQVANAVPDFQKIDTSPQFKKWLDGLDAYGTLRMDALRKAQANKDVARIISFYNDFKQIQEPIKVDPRELQQTPSSTNSGRATNPRSSKVWDQASIQQFYKDSALGKIPKEKYNEVEQDIRRYLSGQ